MTTTVSRAFVAERAYNLALTHLPPRDGVRFMRGDPETGIDLLVTVDAREGAPAPIFGVQLAARRRKVAGAGRLDTISDGHAQRPIADPSIPVCLFLFTMEDDRGYYRWLREPTLTRKHAATLREPAGVRWTELSAAEIDRVFAEILAWYRARPRRQAA
jgi:Domain of unknown function (DUF4365)